jgi:hypothetical protein
MKMEIMKQEFVVVEGALSARVEVDCRELSEMELALIGGGQGDVALG